jgi:hypothetical protein
MANKQKLEQKLGELGLEMATQKAVEEISSRVTWMDCL